jgi:hypothetical protein
MDRHPGDRLEWKKKRYGVYNNVARAKFGGPSWISGGRSGVSVRARDCSHYRLDRMKGAAITDPDPGPVPAIYSLRCILGAPRTSSQKIWWIGIWNRYSFTFMIELTSVVISKGFRCHIIWIWRNLTVLWNCDFCLLRTWAIGRGAFKSSNQW